MNKQIKKNIVIVNEFSYKTKSGGTRGGTPGMYVQRYMARDGATEVLAPASLNSTDNYIVKYMARETAVEKLSYKDLAKFKEAEDFVESKSIGLGGLAFGSFGKKDNGDLSMSDSKLKKLSKAIQKGFDNGKTVLKTVISFETDYLKEMGVLPKDLNVDKKGDLRNKVDQVKLRSALLYGMERLKKRFDNLAYIGTIQIDTKHVHSHLAMVDLGKGRVIDEKGMQKGKLKSKDLNVLRSGIERKLKELLKVRITSSQFNKDRQNVKDFVKKRTVDLLHDNGDIQYLRAILPEDKKLWRYGSNAEVMKRPNAFAKSIVQKLFKNKNSGYDKALLEIKEYSEYRFSRDKITKKEAKKLVDKGVKKLEEQSVNAVYSVLKNFDVAWQSDFIDVVTQNEEVLKERVSNKDNVNKLIKSTVRLKSYNKEFEKAIKGYREFEAIYNDAQRTLLGVRQTGSNKGSFDFAEFCKNEAEYNRLKVLKYRELLGNTVHFDSFNKELESINNLKIAKTKIEEILDDEVFSKMDTLSQSEYLKGKKLPFKDKNALESNLKDMDRRIYNKETRFNREIKYYGLKVEDGILVSETHNNKKLVNQVIAVDLHSQFTDESMIDDSGNLKVSSSKLKKYMDLQQERFDHLRDAINFLRRTDQIKAISDMPVDDIISANKFSNNVDIVENGKYKNGKIRSKYIVNVRRLGTLDMDGDGITDTVDKEIIGSKFSKGNKKVKKDLESVPTIRVDKVDYNSSAIRSINMITSSSNVKKTIREIEDEL